MRSKSGPGGSFYHYGLCEMAQRQAVSVRKDKPSDRAIRSDRAKVVMNAGCLSKKFLTCRIIFTILGRDKQIKNYFYLSRRLENIVEYVNI